MLKSDSIEADLQSLEDQFQKAGKRDEVFLQRCFGKLALLELSGWIENSVDEIIEKHCKKILKKKNLLERSKEVIKGVYTFDYQALTKLITRIFGMAHFLLIEEEVIRIFEKNKLEAFKAELHSLKEKRDNYAHNSLGFIQNIDAPQVHISSLKLITEGLNAFDKAIRKKLK